MKLFCVSLIVQCWSVKSYHRNFEIFSLSVVFISLEESLSFKFVVQILSLVLRWFRFLVYVLMLIPSNVNIPNSFTNVCLLTNTRSLINLKFLIFQRKQIFNFLSDALNSHLKLLVRELMEFWQEAFSYELSLWTIWKLHQYLSQFQKS